MKMATTDRGAFLRVAGLGRLSPALADGAPRLAPEGDGAGRCGWQPFFEAVEQAGLAIAWDPEDPAAASLVGRGAARELAHPGHPASPLAEARRFIDALRPKPPAP